MGKYMIVRSGWQSSLDVECLWDRIVKIRDRRDERWIGIHLLKLFSLST
jgi:hypothetical protein